MKFLRLIIALTRTSNTESSCSPSGDKSFKVKMQTVSDTPRSDARSLEPAEDAAPTKQLFCSPQQGFVVSLFQDGHLEINGFLARIAHGLNPHRITGDPHYDCIALNRLVPPSCSDGHTFLRDHHSLMERLSLPSPSHEPCPANHVF